MEPIRVNLATLPYLNRRMVYSALFVTAIFVLFVSAFNIQLSFHLQDEIFRYEKKIQRLDRIWGKRQQQPAKKRVKLDSGMKKSIEEGAEFVNRLIINDVFPWDQLLDLLEKRAPPNVILKGIRISEDFQKLTIQGEALSVKQMSFFLKSLARSQVLEKNVLSTLSVEKGTVPFPEGRTGKVILFEIESTIRTDQLLGPLRQKRAKPWSVRARKVQ